MSGRDLDERYIQILSALSLVSFVPPRQITDASNMDIIRYHLTQLQHSLVAANGVAEFGSLQQATEEDLWAIFAPIGQVLELYVLRNNNAKSRGCAFVTYASKHLAEQAITQLNGRQMPYGKTLVVKFADRAAANKSSMGLLDFYMS